MELPILCWRHSSDLSDWTLNVVVKDPTEDCGSIFRSPAICQSPSTCGDVKVDFLADLSKESTKVMEADKSEEPETTTRQNEPDDAQSTEAPTSEEATQASEHTVRSERGDHVYNLHKCILVCGPRGSTLFAKLVRQGGIEHTLELPELAIVAVPTLLDFMYHDKFDLKPKNAVSVYYLADLLGIEKLRKEARDYVQATLSVETFGTFLDHSILLNLPLIQKDVAKLVALNVHLLKDFRWVLGATFWKEFSFCLWEAYQTVYKNDTKVVHRRSRFYSQFLAPLLRRLDEASFAAATSVTALPSIDPSVVTTFLRYSSFKIELADRCAAVLKEHRPSNLGGLLEQLPSATLARIILELQSM